jgi:hypothetical protein
MRNFVRTSKKQPLDLLQQWPLALLKKLILQTIFHKIQNELPPKKTKDIRNTSYAFLLFIPIRSK